MIFFAIVCATCSIGDIAVRRGGVVVAYVGRSYDKRIVRLRKQKVCFGVAVEVDFRLYGRNQISIVGICYGISVDRVKQVVVYV